MTAPMATAAPPASGRLGNYAGGLTRLVAFAVDIAASWGIFTLGVAGLTFAINQPRLVGGYAVTDAEALDAMAFAFRHLKIVLEPGGAVALAAVLSGNAQLDGRTALVVASGGNVDAEVYSRALGAP